MMNQHYDLGQAYRFNGRREDPRDRTRVPYRRPNSRSPLVSYPGSTNTLDRGGCGCGLPVAPRGRESLPESRPMPPTAADRAPRQSGCGCGSSHSSHRDVATNGCDCGCNHTHGSCDGQRNKLMEKIQAVDFALYEIVLYLDVYPHSCDALETYHKLMAERDALHAEYENTYGPLTPFGNQSHTTWDWFDKPFPWEYDAE